MKPTNSFRSPRTRVHAVSAFTLLELLVVAAIMAVVVGLGGAVYSGAQSDSQTMRETAAGRSLIVGYLAAAVDNGGRFLPAIDKAAGGSAKRVYFEPYSRNVTMLAAPHNYPFRLAPYINNRLEGTVLLRENTDAINNAFNKISRTNPMSDYGIALYPVFGINSVFLGGEIGSSGRYEYSSEQEAVMRQVNAPSRMLAFASSNNQVGADAMGGFHRISAPRGRETWSGAKWQKGSTYEAYGHLDARHDGKVLAIYLDGSIQFQTIDELRDMRIWSANAASEDNPDYEAVF